MGHMAGEGRPGGGGATAGAALTSGSAGLALLLLLLPLGQSAEGFGRLLQLEDQELDVVQNVVEDLLRGEEDCPGEAACDVTCCHGSLALTTSRST